MAESFLQSLIGGYQLGSKIKQDRNQSKLAQLASQAYSAPQSDRQGILAQAVGVDPGAGMALGKSLQGVDDQRTKTLVQAARYLTAAPEASRPAIYQQMKPSLAHFGMQLPDQYDDTVAQTAQALVQAYGGIGDSSELKTFNAMTQGLKPDEVAKARQIALGLQPRAVTGAIKFDTFQGADGRPRPQRNNPTTGGIEIFYDEMGQWVPLGQGQGQQAPAQQQPQGWQQTGPAMFVAEDGQPIPQEDQQALMAAVRQAEATGGEVNVPASQPAQGGALPPRLDYQNGGQRVPGLGVGRSPEEQAALTTAAQERVKLGLLPVQGQIEADNAAAKKEAEQSVERMPPAVMTMVQELEEKASTASGILDRMKGHRQKIEAGKLDFGPISNQAAKARNFMGASDEKSRNFQLFMSDLEKMRNDSLRLNNGVQTEGDAQRAWNELFANLNDKEYVLAGLDRIDKINQRAAQLYKQQAEQVRQSYPGGRVSGSAPSESPQTNSVLRYNPATGDFE